MQHRATDSHDLMTKLDDFIPKMVSPHFTVHVNLAIDIKAQGLS